MARGYLGQTNGVDLFRSSITVDDFTTSGVRTVHFVLLQDHLNLIKSQMDRPGGELPNTMSFTLQRTQDVRSQMSAFTLGEEFQADMTWEPEAILPGEATKFIFTIQDAATGEILRHSSYDFVLEQDGQTVYRTSGVAAVGGDFVEYTFDEEHGGPAIVRIEDIRGAGQYVEFGFVAVPGFGAAVMLALAAFVMVLILMRTRLSYNIASM